MSFQMTRNRYILLLIVITSISLAIYVPHYGLIYDGGLYASLGYSLLTGNGYFFNGYPGDVPPMLPIFLAIFICLFGENAIFLSVSFFSIIFVILSFMLFEKRFSLELSFLGALYLFFTPTIFYDSVNVIREIPLLTFVMASYLVYFWKNDSYKKHILLGVLIATSFLTKSVGIIYTFPIFFSYLTNLNKKIIISFMTTLIVTIPWFVWSYLHFGKIFVSHSAYLISDVGSGTLVFFTRTIPIFIITAFPLMVIVAFLGIKKSEKIFWGFGLLVILSCFLWPVQEVRYLLAGYFLLAYFGLMYLKDKKKFIGLSFMAIAVLFQFSATVSVLETKVVSYGLLDEAGGWLRENTDQDAKIMTQSFRQIHYFSHRLTYQIPQDPSFFQRTLEREGIEYVVIDSYEKTTPKYAREFFKDLTPLVTFKDSYGKVDIYRSPYYNASRIDT